MATHIDNSQTMSATDIKNALINTFKRSAEKSVNEAAYDKTILATIQTCTDATIGQYKIKYQNGYFTAYAQDTSVIYNNQASVYVQVPKNDMNNKMFIIGLATDDTSQKSYINNLEGDQIFMKVSPNLLTVNDNIDMASYWSAPNTYIRVLYDSKKNSGNLISVNTNVLEYMKNKGATAIRFGAEFKTNLIEERKTGNYGIRLRLKFAKRNSNNEITEEYTKDYELDTFRMSGSPFNFNVYIPQYQYWDVPLEDFEGVETIYEFMTGFPQGTIPSESFRDIFIKNLTLHSAIKLYNTNNDKYKVEIIAERGTIFETDDSANTSLSLLGNLRVDGNIIPNPASQGLKCYWGKEDVSINTIKNPRYNEHLGKGWYCLNTANKKKNDGETVEQLKNPDVYTYQADEVIQNASDISGWNSQFLINLLKKMCPGKTTRIKCVIVYQNVPYEQIIEITNKGGYYIVLNTTDKATNFYNGAGFTNILAGLFRDNNGSLDVSKTLQAHFVWSEIDEVGLEKSLPLTSAEDILLSYPEWDVSKDNETKTDTEVENYLNTHPEASLCRERYNYYLDKYSTYLADGEDIDTSIEMQRSLNREENIINTKINNIEQMYVSNNKNDAGYYIFGPSAVTGSYISSNVAAGAQIDSSTQYFYGTTQYNTYKNVNNTLYHLRIKNIGNRATYKVTAFITENGITQAIETREITLVNTAASMKYNLEIVNGDQVFMYNVAGLAPTISSGSTTPIALRPLYFKLYGSDGGLLYDSQDPNNELFKTNITELSPKWSYNTKSLIKTSFSADNPICEIDSNNGNILIVNGQALFKYDIQEQFDNTKRDNSNIQLQVTYNKEQIIASTHFTFAKQGELGTNGTDMYLDIDDNTYEQYRSDVLSRSDYSEFNNTNGNNNTIDYFYPDQRHLKNTYLYATKGYSASQTEVNDINEARYVNLKFANSGTVDASTGKISLQGSDSATIVGYWYEDGNREIVNADSEWSTELDSGWIKTDNDNQQDGVDTKKKVYMTPSFTLTQSKGQQTTLKITYLNDDPQYGYKPSLISNYVVDNVEYEHIANNVVRVKSEREVASQIDPITGNPIKRVNYGYYTIPFYYFNYGSNTSELIDPARHIVITGGYDEVVYDSSGLNPEYNKQTPFKFYLFDENGKDITQDVITAAKNGTSGTVIEWKCSGGFRKQQYSPSVTAYSSFGANEQLYGKYCSYNGSYYKCNTKHTKAKSITLNGKTYAAGAFVTPYWDKVDYPSMIYQQCNFIPNSTYNSLVTSNLFNSWIELDIHYKDKTNKTYIAQALIPINVICNKYGSEEINGWDGKKTKVDDAYIISNKVAAGVKNNDNTFTGVTIGQSFYAENSTKKSEIGIFGYGHTDCDVNNPNSWARTLFIDANTGLGIFGPSGGAQIVLNPRVSDNQEQWSRLAGWYMSPNYFYKPIGEGDDFNPPSFNDLAQGRNFRPSQTNKGSAGMYVPYKGQANDDDTFIWASNTNITYQNPQNAKFRVTYGGKLYAQNADITGTVRANSGFFGNNSTGIKINYTDTNNDNYILWNKNFWVKNIQGQHNEDIAVYVDGRIMARSGQFGQVGEDKDGTSSNTVFIEYAWYPWHLPADDEPWDSDHMYLDTSQGKTKTYALYHKNFYIDNTGDVFFNGKIFTETGRIGNWVITRSKLKSVDGGVEVGPSQIKLGAFTATAAGRLEGPNWYITPDGVASFTSPQNVFTAKELNITQGILRIPTGSRLYIGDGNDNYLYADGVNGSFHGPKFSFSDTVEVTNTLQFGAAQGNYGAMALSKDSGLRMDYQGDQYYFSLGGNIYCSTLEVKTGGRVTVEGMSLDTYIQQIIYNNLSSLGIVTKSDLHSYNVSETGLVQNTRVVYGP